MHDNIRIHFQKETQRINNQTHGDNGTSATLVEIHDPAACDLLRGFRAPYLQQDEHLRSLPELPKIGLEEFYDPANQAIIKSRSIDLLISTLLATKYFDKFKYKDDARIAPPMPIHQLPTGKDHRTKFRMITSVPIEEASYDGNLLVMKKVFTMLYGGALKVDMKRRIGSQGIPWLGDWLTYSRLLGCKQFRRNDGNSFDRMDWLIPCFGLFHMVMLFANTLLTTHRGYIVNYGLSRSIHILGIKGLAENTQKPYFHTVETLLDTVFKAKVEALWLWSTGKTSMKDVFKLFNKSSGPADMRVHAQKIFEQRGSTHAANNPDIAGDKVLRDSILLTRDLLFYWMFHFSIRAGDVGLVETLLPTLGLYFKGAGSHNYAKSIVEWLQFRRYEAPPGLW
jgi:hypothetical protein